MVQDALVKLVSPHNINDQVTFFWDFFWSSNGVGVSVRQGCVRSRSQERNTSLQNPVEPFVRAVCLVAQLKIVTKLSQNSTNFTLQNCARKTSALGGSPLQHVHALTGGCIAPLLPLRGPLPDKFQCLQKSAGQRGMLP